MADFEDANSPTWEQLHRRPDQPVRRRAPHDRLRRSRDGKAIRAERQDRRADGAAARLASAGEARARRRRADVGALFDFGLYLLPQRQGAARRTAPAPISICRRWRATSRRGCGTRSSCGAGALGMPRGTITRHRADRDHPGRLRDGRDPLRAARPFAGLNCGRWDYIFSFIKKFAEDPAAFCRTAAQVTMTSHFLRAYSLLLIKTCHRRGVHAMGGMAAQIPISDDPAANEAALDKVRADKLREAGDGHDGTWVAHPGLVPIAKEVFDGEMPRPNQIARLREDVQVTAADLLAVPQGHDHRGRPAPQHQRRHPLYRGLAARQRLRAALQPDGRRRHGRDLPRPDLAVDPPRRGLADGRKVTRELGLEDRRRGDRKAARAGRRGGLSQSAATRTPPSCSAT